MYVRELHVCYRRRSLAPRRGDPARLQDSTEAAAVFTRLLHDEAVEVCGVLCLNTRHDILAYHELSRGTLDGASLFPRDVFRVALLSHAHAVIIGHNHPSGDPSPSGEDVAVTRQLVQAGALMGIPVLDHVIVTPERCYSLRDAGLV